MTDLRNSDAIPHPDPIDTRVDFGPEGVGLSRLSSKAARRAPVNLEMIRILHQGALDPNQAACRKVPAIADQMGIDNEMLADIYIPAVAHQMGRMWCEDTLGFAEVTIGVSRLQALLRDLGPEWSADIEAKADAPVILLAAPEGAHHTLGCVILAGQLRRRGYSVRMALDPSRDAFLSIMTKMNFDAVFISASQGESLEKLRKMVDFLRTLTAKPLPIAVGGGLLDVHDDIASLIGVDIATSDIDEAIEHCGLAITQNRRGSRARRE